MHINTLKKNKYILISVSAILFLFLTIYYTANDRSSTDIKGKIENNPSYMSMKCQRTNATRGGT